tara:strand:+ start:520 stop:774 length:255 start_codon:yes stop_codon:yes gene_type:complete
MCEASTIGWTLGSLAAASQTGIGRKAFKNVREGIGISENPKTTTRDDPEKTFQQNFYGSGWNVGKAGKQDSTAKPMNRSNLNIG